jgi:hypothetical protein
MNRRRNPQPCAAETSNAFMRLRAFLWAIAPWQPHYLHTIIVCPDNEQLQWLRKAAARLLEDQLDGRVTFQQARGFSLPGDKEPKTLRDGQFAIIDKKHVRVLWLFWTVNYDITYMDTI